MEEPAQRGKQRAKLFFSVYLIRLFSPGNGIVVFQPAEGLIGRLVSGALTADRSEGVHRLPDVRLQVLHALANDGELAQQKTLDGVNACWKCGADVAPGAVFCASCGAKQEQDAPNSPVTPPPAAGRRSSGWSA